MTDAILLTGGTGFLGTEIASRLIGTADGPVYVLVRAENAEAAAHRLRTAWFHDKLLLSMIGTRIIPVTGDFTVPGLALDEEMRKRLADEVSLVFHAGAQISFQKGRSELMRVNRDGTGHVLDFASDIKRLRRFVHISTAYVSGQRSGRILEADPAADEFSSPYEESKAAAEHLVRSSGLPWMICRPGMIIGDSATGRVKNFNTVYYVLKLFLTGKLRILPVSRDMRLNLVPVDAAADSIVKIGLSDSSAGRTFHVTCPSLLQPTVEELTTYVRVWASVYLDTELPAPVFLPAAPLKRTGLLYNSRITENRKKNFAANLLAILPYFFCDQDYDRSNTDEIAGPFLLNWRSFIGPALSFAASRNFMQQTGRTVFEQAAVRNASKRYPIRYHNVTSDEITEMSGAGVNDGIRRIRDALYAWGIRQGDRIALTGINSIEYMMLDHAIGLSGAVSVPIYYTTPADEIGDLLQRSGSKWLFIGDRRIMEHIEEMDPSIHLVSFSDGLSIHRSSVIAWDEFLDRADMPAPEVHVDPEDLATIRYTSGTTGDPKGVKFSFSQLAWMGEVLTGLLPWQDRNGSMRYLSFLPLSHVVEGILASYAPYYALANVDYYYLNDFSMLAETLPRVRPNVFFSVPRFYEKIWDQLISTPAGKRYIRMKDGPARRTLAGILRRQLLKKAGLDACRQLIVGSAPVSEQLLLNFRGLGIEIYNAYGQAEAPLITINRMRDNVIPTVGTPLPQTTVSCAPDGELIVEGPQVCLGYYGLETDTIQNGVLKTGDLGRIREDGHIVLFGRKKEMIITAYGKNISIPRIEERLKNITGVSEAVLIGENRPYCTCLLWLDRPVPDLDRQIRKMNASLSHPEQIRKYRIISEPLSITGGDLTPNLKVRRANVEARFKSDIEEMYR